MDVDKPRKRSGSRSIKTKKRSPKQVSLNDRSQNDKFEEEMPAVDLPDVRDGAGRYFRRRI